MVVCSVLHPDPQKYPTSSGRGNGSHERVIGRCSSGSREFTVRNTGRGHRHGLIQLRVVCWDRRLGGEESILQLPDLFAGRRFSSPIHSLNKGNYIQISLRQRADEQDIDIT
jgi:hypothetical protein